MVNYWRSNILGGLEMLAADFSGQRFARHWHPGYALGVVTRGAERFYCQGGSHVVGPGGIISINPGEIHDGEPVEEGWSYRMIYPSEELIRRIHAELMGNDSAQSTPAFREPVLLDENLAIRLVDAHRKAYLVDTGEVSRLEAETQLYLIITDLLRRHIDGRDGKKTGSGLTDTQRLRPAIELINEDLARDLSLDSLAEVVGVGRFHLLRLFKSHFGCPPHAYVLQRRVAKGKALLDQGVSAGNAALETGFFDQSHFANAFRHTYGMTPRTYQKGGSHIASR